MLLKVDECRMCACGMMRSEERDHTLACPKNPWGPRIHDRVRDGLAKQLRRMGATVDLERVAPQWSKKYKYKEGNDEYRVARIDVVATILGLMSCSGSTSQSGGQRQQRKSREAQKAEDSHRSRERKKRRENMGTGMRSDQTLRNRSALSWVEGWEHRQLPCFRK